MKHLHRFLAVVGLSFAFLAPVHAQQVVLRYAGTLPITHHLTKGQNMFATLVSEKTGGKVKVEVYPAGQLYKAHDIPAAVATGALDIGFNLTNVWTKDAISEINDVPFLFRDENHAQKAWDPSGRLFTTYTQTLSKRQIKPLGVMFFGSLFDISSRNRAMVDPSDFDKQKIRTYGALASESIRALGGSPATMDPGEMYLGLQNGTIDAAITGLTSIDKRKLWEAAKHATIANAAFGVFAVNMNLSKFNALPKEHQNALMEAAREVFEWSVKESAKEDRESLEFLKKNINVVVLTPQQKEVWAKRLVPVVKSWEGRATADEKALLTWIRGL
jgi:TRAP-type C4-dicarboxylate transport system substrate-binding protein